MPLFSRDPEAAPVVEVEGIDWPADTVIRCLRRHVTEERADRLSEIVDHRTVTVLPVVEGLYDMGNVSAVMRSAEALGCQELHVIESKEDFKASNRTSGGADKWLDVIRWSDPDTAINGLREAGYRVAACHQTGDRTIEELDYTRRTALFFGNEAEGLSETTVRRADQRCRVPMIGFVESYNISVAAAITLYAAYRDRRDKLGRMGDFSTSQRKLLQARYYLRSVDAAKMILRRYAEENELDLNPSSQSSAAS